MATTPEPPPFFAGPVTATRPVAPSPPASAADQPWGKLFAGGAIALLAVTGGAFALSGGGHDAHPTPRRLVNETAIGVALTSELHQAGLAEETWRADNDAYTASVADLQLSGFRGTTVTGVSAGPTDYCLQATSPSKATVLFMSRAGISSTAC